MVLFLIGLASGIVSGMGIGGGTVLIPALAIFLNSEQHAAQGANLVFFIPTAVIALVVHIRNRMVDIKTALPIIIAGLAGALAGSAFASVLSGMALRRWFGVFLLAMGLYETVRKGNGDERKRIKGKCTEKNS